MTPSPCPRDECTGIMIDAFIGTVQGVGCSQCGHFRPHPTIAELIAENVREVVREVAPGPDSLLDDRPIPKGDE